MTTLKTTNDTFPNILVAVGSVDGICAAAAYCRWMMLNGQELPEVIFTQAFLVNRIDPTQWPEGSLVGMLDLAVNHQDPSMTLAFVQAIYEAGHAISFIADEHDSAAWRAVLDSTPQLDWEDMAIQPSDRDVHPSTCDILLEAGIDIDQSTREILTAGSEADRADGEKTEIGDMINRCTRGNMGDPHRRPHLVTRLATDNFPSPEMQGWMQEYDQIEANHPVIIAARQQITEGIYWYDAKGRIINLTGLMMSQYRNGSPVVLVTGVEVFINPSQGKMECTSIGTNMDIDLRVLMEQAGVPVLSGFEKKVQVASENTDDAIAVLRTLEIEIS